MGSSSTWINLMVRDNYSHWTIFDHCPRDVLEEVFVTSFTWVKTQKARKKSLSSSNHSSSQVFRYSIQTSIQKFWSKVSAKLVFIWLVRVRTASHTSQVSIWMSSDWITHLPMYIMILFEVLSFSSPQLHVRKRSRAVL